MRDGKIVLACDRIADFDVYRAVCFAVAMVRRGTPPNVANARAAKYYRVPIGDVAFYSGQHAGRIAASRRERSRGANS